MFTKIRKVKCSESNGGNGASGYNRSWPSPSQALDPSQAVSQLAGSPNTQVYQHEVCGKYLITHQNHQIPLALTNIVIYFHIPSTNSSIEI